MHGRGIPQSLYSGASNLGIGPTKDYAKSHGPWFWHAPAPDEVRGSCPSKKRQTPSLPCHQFDSALIWQEPYLYQRLCAKSRCSFSQSASQALMYQRYSTNIWTRLTIFRKHLLFPSSGLVEGRTCEGDLLVLSPQLKPRVPNRFLSLRCKHEDLSPTMIGCAYKQKSISTHNILYIRFQKYMMIYSKSLSCVFCQTPRLLALPDIQYVFGIVNRPVAEFPMLLHSGREHPNPSPEDDMSHSCGSWARTIASQEDLTTLPRESSGKKRKTWKRNQMEPAALSYADEITRFGTCGRSQW